MKVDVTNDMVLVKEMAADVWDRMSEDGTDIDDFLPYNCVTSGWLLCSEGDDNVGVILIHNNNTTAVEIHPYVMPEFAGSGSEMMMGFFKWFIDNVPKRVNKVNVKIPFAHKSVYNFAKKLGFIDEGIDRQSFTKDGEISDRWSLGLTRDEILEINNE